MHSKLNYHFLQPATYKVCGTHVPTHPHSLSLILHGVIVSPFRPPSPVPFNQLNKVGCLASLTQESMSKELMGSWTLCVPWNSFIAHRQVWQYSISCAAVWHSKIVILQRQHTPLQLPTRSWECPFWGLLAPPLLQVCETSALHGVVPAMLTVPLYYHILQLNHYC